MRNRTWSPGLRARLAGAIVLIVLVALGIAFFAVYRGTESELENRTEDDLVAKVEQVTGALERGGTGGLAGAARQVVANEPTGPGSVVVAISVEGEGRFTNQPELLFDREDEDPGEERRKEGEEEDEERESEEYRKEAERFWSAPDGFSDSEVEDVGDVLVLTALVDAGPDDRAVVRAAESTKPTEEALEGLRGTFLRVGLVALVAAAALAWLMASRLTRPLRRLTELSGQVG